MSSLKDVIWTSNLKNKGNIMKCRWSFGNIGGGMGDVKKRQVIKSINCFHRIQGGGWGKEGGEAFVLNSSYCVAICTTAVQLD